MECIKLVDYLPPGYVTDGSVDYSAELNTAIGAAVAGCRRVEMPEFAIGIASTIALTELDAVMIYGNGGDNSNPLGNSLVGSKLLWIGDKGGTMLTITNTNGGGIEGMALDGNSLAANCLIIDGGCHGYYARNALYGFTTGVGLKTTATSHTMSWNTFIDNSIIGLGDGKAAMWVSGGPAGPGSFNTCLNTWINTTLIHYNGTRVGLLLGPVDNNTFIDTTIGENNGGVSPGVLCDPEDTINTRPNGNYFFRLLPGGGGWVQPATLTLDSPATIYGYGKSNGEPDPVIPEGTSLLWTDEWGRQYGNQLTTTDIIEINGNDSAADTTTARLRIRPTAGTNGGTPKTAELALLANNYATSFTSTFLAQHGSNSTGDIAGISKADLAHWFCLNVSAMLIGSNQDAPIIFAPGNSEKMRLSNAGLALSVPIIEEALINPTLLNGWVNFGGGAGVAAYYKSKNGRVYCSGLIKNGSTTPATALFTFPVGYRPAADQTFACASNAAYGEVTVKTTGDVLLYAGNATAFSLASISFRV